MSTYKGGHTAPPDYRWSHLMDDLSGCLATLHHFRLIGPSYNIRPDERIVEVEIEPGNLRKVDDVLESLYNLTRWEKSIRVSQQSDILSA